MDVFSLRDRLVGEFGSYVRSFIHIADERIKDLVDSALAEGLLRPEPLIQLNRSFESGGTIDELGKAWRRPGAGAGNLQPIRNVERGLPGLRPGGSTPTPETG